MALCFVVFIIVDSLPACFLGIKFIICRRKTFGRINHGQSFGWKFARQSHSSVRLTLVYVTHNCDVIFRNSAVKNFCGLFALKRKTKMEIKFAREPCHLAAGHIKLQNSNVWLINYRNVFSHVTGAVAPSDLVFGLGPQATSSKRWAPGHRSRSSSDKLHSDTLSALAVKRLARTTTTTIKRNCSPVLVSLNTTNYDYCLVISLLLMSPVAVAAFKLLKHFHACVGRFSLRFALEGAQLPFHEFSLKIIQMREILVGCSN